MLVWEQQNKELEAKIYKETRKRLKFTFNVTSGTIYLQSLH